MNPARPDSDNRLAYPLGPPDRSPTASFVGVKALLAEDCEDAQLLLTTILEDLGIDVTVVANGETCVEEALMAQSIDDPFDVVLVDLRMPVMNGYGAINNLRKLGYGGLTIAITADFSLSTRMKCIHAGFDLCLAKGTLVDTIERTLKVNLGPRRRY